MKKNRQAGWKAALPFLLPSMVGFTLFSILPMITQLFISVTDWDGLSELTLFSDFGGFMQQFFVGLQNYVEIFTSKELYQVLGNTLWFIVLYIPLMLVAAMAVAANRPMTATADVFLQSRMSIPSWFDWQTSLA